MKRAVIKFLFVALIFAASAVQAGELEDGATAFVKSLEQEAVSKLTSNGVPREQRVESFRMLFNDKFAVNVIGRWTLGRNWRKANKEERAEFLKLFEDLMVVTYVDRFATYTGNGLTYTKTVPVDENRVTVHSQIKRPGSTESKPVNVLWRVGRKGDIYKVLDVVIEGASMSVTLQREFAAIVKNTGSVAGLIEELRKKTAELSAS